MQKAGGCFTSEWNPDNNNSVIEQFLPLKVSFFLENKTSLTVEYHKLTKEEKRGIKNGSADWLQFSQESMGMSLL